MQWSMIGIGLAFFLFGIHYLSQAMQNALNNQIQLMLSKITASLFKSILISTTLTALIQSSSGTTAIIISLIQSHVITFKQSLGLIIGANIGTTVTAILVSFPLCQFAIYFIMIGSLLIFFCHHHYYHLGQILFALGCLFYGLELMSTHLSLLSKYPQFQYLITVMQQHYHLAFLGGILLTCSIQSSSAMIAIIQQLYGIHAMSLYIALAFLYGSNIGTTITAIIAAINGSVETKRAACFHSLFNILGSVIFMIFLIPNGYLLSSINQCLQLSPKMLLAFAHALFNIITAICIYPFLNLIARKIESWIC